MILSLGVRRLRASWQQNYDSLPKSSQFTFNLLTVAAIRRPPTTLVQVRNADELPCITYADKADALHMRKKIMAVFQLAASTGQKHLVLGALGCGVFKNPTPDIVRFYKEAVDIYGGHFSTIVFAIWDEQPIKENSNYMLFKNTFTTK